MCQQLTLKIIIGAENDNAKTQTIKGLNGI